MSNGAKKKKKKKKTIRHTLFVFPGHPSYSLITLSTPLHFISFLPTHLPLSHHFLQSRRVFHPFQHFKRA